MRGGARAAAQDLLRAAASRRWLLAAGLAAAAVATALPVLAPEPGEARTVLTAAHDLAPGTTLSAGDLTQVAVPAAAVPDGVLPDAGAAAGRLIAGGMRRGEPLTDARLVGPGLLARLAQRPGGDAAELVAVPVRLADPAGAALLRPGDRVDVLAAATSPGTTTTSADVVAAGVPVLVVPTVAPDAEGGLVVLATAPATAARLAAAAVTSRLSVAVLP